MCWVSQIEPKYLHFGFCRKAWTAALGELRKGLDFLVFGGGIACYFSQGFKPELETMETQLSRRLWWRVFSCETQAKVGSDELSS